MGQNLGVPGEERVMGMRLGVEDETSSEGSRAFSEGRLGFEDVFPELRDSRYS